MLAIVRAVSFFSDWYPRNCFTICRTVSRLMLIFFFLDLFIEQYGMSTNLFTVTFFFFSGKVNCIFFLPRPYLIHRRVRNVHQSFLRLLFVFLEKLNVLFLPRPDLICLYFNEVIGAVLRRPIQSILGLSAAGRNPSASYFQRVM